MTEAAYRTTPEDVEVLRQHGWSEPQIAEAVYITAMFAFFNRVADAFGETHQLQELTEHRQEGVEFSMRLDAR